MAQYKKDEIREAIEKVALDMFFENGYRQTKIQKMAEEANVSVGNVYRYFKSKEEIFYAIITKSFVDTLKDILYRRTIILSKKYLGISVTNAEENWYEQDYIDFLINNRKQLTILFLENKGTKYENIKDELIKKLMVAKEKFLKNYYKDVDIDDNFNIFMMIISSNINLIINILEKDMSIKERKKLLKAIDNYHLHGITGLWNNILKEQS